MPLQDVTSDRPGPCFWLPVGALLGFMLLASSTAGAADAQALRAEVDRRTAKLGKQLVNWRRDFHQHPELSNREVRTSRVIAKELSRLGFDVRTGVAHTGVVAFLRGAKARPVVALRADMDALPVTERTDLPFKSTVRTTYDGEEVGVMHACGHDVHMTALLGAAEVLAGMREKLPGSVKLIFQPAEEGPPKGERGGSELMIEQGALENPAVDAIFGLHVFPFPLGTLATRGGGLMASADTVTIKVTGKQTHGAIPWAGVDPIVVSAQIVLGLQTIVSRQLEITRAPAIVTIGKIRGGNRSNIVPEEVTLVGTIRSLDPEMRKQVHERVRRTATSIAESAGAVAEVTIKLGPPVLYNDAALVRRMTPTLRRLAGDKLDDNIQPATTAEDFARYGQKVPGMFFFLGVLKPGLDAKTAPANHSPYFDADERALPLGVRALGHLVVDFLASPNQSPQGDSR